MPGHIEQLMRIDEKLTPLIANVARNEWNIERSLQVVQDTSSIQPTAQHEMVAA